MVLPPPMQSSLPAGWLSLYREGVEPSGSLQKVSDRSLILLFWIYPGAREVSSALYWINSPFAVRDAMEYAQTNHSALIPASLMIGHHFSISALDVPLNQQIEYQPHHQVYEIHY